MPIDTVDNRCNVSRQCILKPNRVGFIPFGFYLGLFEKGLTWWVKWVSWVGYKWLEWAWGIWWFFR